MVNLYWHVPFPPLFLNILWYSFHISIWGIPSCMCVSTCMHACRGGGGEGSVLHVIHSTGGYLYNSESHSVLSDSLWPHGLTIQSMEFSRPEYWSGLPFPSPEDFPNQGIEPRSPTLQADSLQPVPPGKPIYTISHLQFLQELFGPGVWVVLISIISLTSTAVSYLQTAGGHLFAYFSQCYQTFESVPISECKRWNWKIVLFAFVVLSWEYFPILWVLFISSFSHL